MWAREKPKELGGSDGRCGRERSRKSRAVGEDVRERGKDVGLRERGKDVGL